MKQKILPEERRPTLRELLDRQNFARVIEAHNGISGLLGERALTITNGKEKGFHALWISSLTDSVAKGYPDEEIVSIDSRLDTVNQVLNVTAKPLMFDGDTGGFPEQLNYLVRQLERLGVSALVIEDKKYPKSNSLLYGASHNLEKIDTFVEKIECAKSFQRSGEFMVFARIETFIVGDPKETAIERAQAYLDAGVDGIMIHSKKPTPDEVFYFAENYNKLRFTNGRKPLMCVPTTYHTTTERGLKDRGFNIILYANHLFRASFLAMQQVCEVILHHDCAKEAEAMCAGLKDILAPVDSIRTYLAEYKQNKNDNLF